MKTDNSNLSFENSTLLLKMQNYLSEKRLRRSDYDRVCEDIQMMLYDAQQRGESAEALFPDGYKKFLDEVVANCSKEKWYVTALSVIFWALAVLAAVTVVITLTTLFWAEDGEYISGVAARVKTSAFVGALLASCLGASVSFFHNIFAFEKKYYYFIAIAVLIAVCIGITVLIEALIKDSFITFNWVALLCASAGAATLIWLARWGILKLNCKR